MKEEPKLVRNPWTDPESGKVWVALDIIVLPPEILEIQVAAYKRMLEKDQRAIPESGEIVFLASSTQ